MQKFIVRGGKKLRGITQVSGSKNMALKALVASCLTSDEVVIHNIPLISDVFIMKEIIEELGGVISISGHTATIKMERFKKNEISLDKAALIRTSSMFVAPLLARMHAAVIPNPGGCRIGARPIDRTIDGLKRIGVNIDYHSEDGFFHANAEKGLLGTHYVFEKNTHTGTETLILAAVMAKGETVLENAAAEPEVDELIVLLSQMGAKVARTSQRTIVIQGVSKLNGAEFTVSPDRNEIVTLAIAAVITGGDVLIKGATQEALFEFLRALDKAGGGHEETKQGIRFFYNKSLLATNVITSSYPGFMTDWQAPWAVLMTQANGVSTIHEAVYESRFGYVSQLRKMGAKIELFNPTVENPRKFYNFNLADDSENNFHAIQIYGPQTLHNAVVAISDLRAGATLVLGALAAKGETAIFGIEHLDRGYEKFEKRLKILGADIQRVYE